MSINKLNIEVGETLVKYDQEAYKSFVVKEAASFTHGNETYKKVTADPVELKQLFQRIGVVCIDTIYNDSYDNSFWRKLIVPIKAITFISNRASFYFRSHNTITESANAIGLDSNGTIVEPYTNLKCVMTLVNGQLKFASMNTRRALASVLGSSKFNGKAKTIPIYVPYINNFFEISTFDSVFVYSTREDPAKPKYRTKMVYGYGKPLKDLPVVEATGAYDRGFNVSHDTNLSSVLAKNDVLEYDHADSLVNALFNVESGYVYRWLSLISFGRKFGKTNHTISSISAARELTWKIEDDVNSRSFLILNEDGSVKDTRILHNTIKNDTTFVRDMTDIYIYSSDQKLYKAVDVVSNGLSVNLVQYLFTKQQRHSIARSLLVRLVYSDIEDLIDNSLKLKLQQLAVQFIRESDVVRSTRKFMTNKRTVYTTNGLDQISTTPSKLLELSEFVKSLIPPNVTDKLTKLFLPLGKVYLTNASKAFNFPVKQTTRIDKVCIDLARIPTIPGNWSEYFNILLHSCIIKPNGFENELKLFIKGACIAEDKYNSLNFSDSINELVTLIENGVYDKINLDSHQLLGSAVLSIFIREVVDQVVNRYIFEYIAEQQYVSVSGMFWYSLNYQLKNVML